jgi:pimeloyl-ACP methyl ester carboxylesterase
VEALNRSFCIRYYLSNAGGEGSRPVVFLQGDYLKTEDERTDDLTKEADHISRNVGTAAIYLARVGRDGSSGSHDMRHSLLELHAANAALQAIKEKHGFEGFHIYGHSGGAMVVGGLLALRTDLACVVIADGRLVGTRKANLRDPALRDYSAADWIPVIARNHSTRILVVSDPKDKAVPIGDQSPFVVKLRKAGGEVEQFLVDAGGFDPGFHHFTMPFAEVAIRDCVHGANNDAIAADLSALVAKSLAAKPRD